MSALRSVNEIVAGNIDVAIRMYYHTYTVVDVDGSRRLSADFSLDDFTIFVCASMQFLQPLDLRGVSRDALYDTWNKLLEEAEIANYVRDRSEDKP